MKTIVGLFREKSGVETALDSLRRSGVAKDEIRIVTKDSNLGVELGGAGGGHIFTAELERGGTLVVVEPSNSLADNALNLLRQAGAADVVVNDDPEGGNWLGRSDGAATSETDEHDGVAVVDRAADREHNNWNASERLAHAADMGSGAAAGGVMGAPLGAGITEAAGGLMGATPGERVDDDRPLDAPNPERQADIERQRRENDPAP